MNHYELVVILDPKLTKQDNTQTVSILEDLLGNTIQDKDDIGILDLAHHLHKIGKSTQAYFISYYLSTDGEQIDALKKKLVFIKGIIKYVFLKMNPSDTFFKFKDLQEKFKEEPKEPKPIRESRSERKERTTKSEEKIETPTSSEESESE